jgi:RimJ/RimL family protein N-acetyltransferase
MTDWIVEGGGTGNIPWARLFGRGDEPDRSRAAPSRLAAAGRPAARPATVDFPRRIETAQLLLDLPRVEDLPFVERMASDPSMFLYSERGPMSPEEAWSLLLRTIGHWSAVGFGVFAVREKESGRFAGLVGGSTFHRGFGPDFDELPEMTWSIASEFRGRGFATEAAAAVIEAFEAGPAPRSTVCLIHVDNQKSLRVASKLSFRFFSHSHYRGYGAGLFRR